MSPLDLRSWRPVDLSLPLEDDAKWAPRWARTAVQYQDHRFGAWAVWWLFGLSARLLKHGLGWANENLRLSTHGATHVDAPYHYGPTCEGRPARTIDEIPLDWFHGPAVTADVRFVASQEAVSVDDLRRALAPLERDLRPGEVLLVRTGNDSLWGSRAYFSAGPGMSAAATHWMLDRGVRLAGIDAWGWDRPLAAQARDALRRGDSSIFWEAHFVGLDREYCHMERLANLGALPMEGAYLFAFPLKVRRGSAGPARVVAFVPPEEGVERS